MQADVSQLTAIARRTSEGTNSSAAAVLKAVADSEIFIPVCYDLCAPDIPGASADTVKARHHSQNAVVRVGACAWHQAVEQYTEALRWCAGHEDTDSAYIGRSLALLAQVGFVRLDLGKHCLIVRQRLPASSAC